MKQTSPLLTAILPAYNAMPFLPQAVQSILNQTWTDFNLLIIDDGSTDSSWAYLSEIRDPRVTVFRQGNKGVGATSHRLLNLCNTPLCARVDADDVLLPDRFRLQIQRFLDCPDLGILGTQISYMVDGVLIAALPFPITHKAIREALLVGRFPLCNPTLMFRTELAKRIGGYRVNGYGEDVDFVLRLSELATTGNINEVLHYQRIHKMSGTYRFSRVNALGLRYAMVCAGFRAEGDPEPEFDEFVARYQSEWHPFENAIDWLEAYATVQYRRYLLARGHGERVSAAAHFAFSAACRPRAVLSRILERLRAS